MPFLDETLFVKPRHFGLRMPSLSRALAAIFNRGGIEEQQAAAAFAEQMRPWRAPCFLGSGPVAGGVIPPGSDGRAFLDPMSISLRARGEKGFPLLGRP